MTSLFVRLCFLPYDCFHTQHFHNVGGTFVMDGFEQQFGWECASDDLSCVPKSQEQIDQDQGLINGLFGVGACL